VPFVVAGTTQGDPEARRRACARTQRPEVAPPGVAHQAPGVARAPLPIPCHLAAPLDTAAGTAAARSAPGAQGRLGTATSRRPPHARRCTLWKNALQSTRDPGECVAFPPPVESGVVVRTPAERHGPAAHHQGDHQQGLMILAGPVHGNTSTSSARHVTERPAAAPLGAGLRLAPFVVPPARHAFHRGFLGALGARAGCLAAGLRVNDRGHERRDRCALMAVCPREECVERVSKACRQRCCCHSQQVRTSRQLVPTRYVTKCVQTSGSVQ